jgi:hypothetical protein
MSKQTGLGAGLLVGGVDLSGDTGAVQRIACPRTVLDLTDITQSAPERALALKDGGIDWMSWFNPARAHPALSALPRTDTQVMYLHRRLTQGTPAAVMTAKQVTYDGNRTQDGGYSLSVASVSNAYGLEWGHSLAEGGINTSTGAEDLVGFDDGAGAATDFGLQAYLQVTALTGTNVVVTIEDSDDDEDTDPYTAVTGAAFTSVTAVPAFERIQTSRTENVKEWLRLAVTGTFTSATFAVVVVRNPYAVTF